MLIQSFQLMLCIFAEHSSGSCGAIGPPYVCVSK